MENEIKKHGLVLDIDENPTKKSQWFLFAVQHILAMLVACITVPLITGLPIGPTLIAAGIGTLIYIACTKKKSPVFLSSSFAYLAPMSTALSLGVATKVNPATGDANFAALMLGMLLVGAVYVAIALIVRAVGTKWLDKVLPPVVIGPIIMVIGLSLAGSAINNVVGGTAGINAFQAKASANYSIEFATALANGSDANTLLGISKASVPWGYVIISVLVAFVACFTTAFASMSKRKNISLIPFVIGMGVAYLFALAVTGLGYATGAEWLKVIDFSPLTSGWDSVSGWITYDFLFVNVFTQKASFDWGTVGQVAVLFIPVSIVTVCEHIGDHKNLGNIIDRDLLNEEPGLTRTLIGDGLATAVSGCFCGAANTTYGENVAVIGVSKIASVSVIILASLMSIALGFFAPLTRLIQTVPSCITGGVSMILYGFIASSGVKLLMKEKVDFGETRNIIIASVILVIGIGGLVIGFGGSQGAYIISISSVACAMLLGMLLNAVLPKAEQNYL